ncbi:hypothetical protein N7520_002359 [Penicillium odoratum]|uniref:uncharacterized protein n=1 Tax=Penicillium odoratum TaxID=1167516 RepID=UPI002547A6F2|nr:uncharacterized protein N7520_002359 [Penicillium odoratum]KAJ5771830.1 hypothetical protein N7520_002359 [Penicillium odoratum]
MTVTSRIYFLDMGMSSSPDYNGRILSCASDGSDLRQLVTGLQDFPDGITVDFHERHIYWTNMGQAAANDGSIQRCDLSGENITTIIPKGVTHTPKQIVLSKHFAKVYWCDRQGMRIMRANKDGSNVEVLYRAGTTEDDRKDPRNWCVGIALDEDRGKLYWTQKGPSKGNQGRLLRTGLNIDTELCTRSPEVEVLLDNLPEPIDLAIDLVKNIIYWTDRGDIPFGNSVNTLNMDIASDGKASPPPKILVRKLHEAIGLCLDPQNQRLYFSDLMGGVYTSRVDGTDKRPLFNDMGDITGMHYVG